MNKTLLLPLFLGLLSLWLLPLKSFAQSDSDPQNLTVSVSASAGNVCPGTSVALHVSVTDNSQQPIMEPSIAVGDVLCTDGSVVKISAWPVAGKTARGIVFYVDNTGQHGWAVHLQDQSQGIAWCPNYNPYFDVPALANITTLEGGINDVDGYSNTQKLRNAGSATMFPAAWAVDFAQQWYVPAIGQLHVLLAEYPKVNESLQTVGGSPLFPFSSILTSYWSSTEYSDYAAWAQVKLGFIHQEGKMGAVNCLRSVRTF